MSFGIKQVKSILSNAGMPLENIDKCAEEICGRHTADIEAIKDERDSFKTSADELKEVQKELDELKAGDYKTKYEAEKAAHDKLKADTAGKEEKARKEKAFSEWLKTEGYTDKGAAKISKYGGFIDGLKLDKDGKIEDIEKLSKAVSDEWGEYKGTKVTEGTTVATPPTGSNTPAPKPSRAAELAAKYHANLYGGSDKPAETHADNTTNNTAKGE